MESEDLRPIDEEILDELHDSARTKGALVDATSYSRNSVYNRLEVLSDDGLIDCVHDGTRLFELQHDPRYVIGDRLYTLTDIPPTTEIVCGSIYCPACGEEIVYLEDSNGFDGLHDVEFSNAPCCDTWLIKSVLVFKPVEALDGNAPTQEQLKQCVLESYEKARAEGTYPDAFEIFIENFGWDLEKELGIEPVENSTMESQDGLDDFA